MRKNLFCLFLAATTLLSVAHILIEHHATSINYVDLFAPCCLLIYGFFLNENDLLT